MSLRVYHGDHGLYSDEEFGRLASQVSRALDEVIRVLQRYRLERAADGAQVKYFGTTPEGSSIPATYYRTGDWLHIYLPVFDNHPDILESVLIHELGHRMWYNHITSTQRMLWNKKYIAADGRTIDRIQHLLNTKKYTRYRDMVEEFDNPNERLVAIHIANALIANKYPTGLTQKLNVREYPATKEFSRGSRLYSLIPLISAYARESDYEDYAETFRAYVESDGTLRQISEESTRLGLVELFEKVTF